jgi:hypothetical protein
MHVAMQLTIAWTGESNDVDDLWGNRGRMAIKATAKEYKGEEV